MGWLRTFFIEISYSDILKVFRRAQCRFTRVQSSSTRPRMGRTGDLQHRRDLPQSGERDHWGGRCGRWRLVWLIKLTILNPMMTIHNFLKLDVSSKITSMTDFLTPLQVVYNITLLWMNIWIVIPFCLKLFCVFFITIYFKPPHTGPKRTLPQRSASFKNFSIDPAQLTPSLFFRIESGWGGWLSEQFSILRHIESFFYDWKDTLFHSNWSLSLSSFRSFLSDAFSLEVSQYNTIFSSTLFLKLFSLTVSILHAVFIYAL